MIESKGRMEDIPFEVRAALYSLTLSKDAPVNLTELLTRMRLSEHYQAIWYQIQGKNNITPTVLIELCKAIGDWTPVILLFGEYGISITIDEDRKVSGNVVREIAEAAAAMGRVHAELANALVDNNINKKELAQIALRATEASREMQDVVSSAGRSI